MDQMMEYVSSKLIGGNLISTATGGQSDICPVCECDTPHALPLPLQPNKSLGFHWFHYRGRRRKEEGETKPSRRKEEGREGAKRRMWVWHTLHNPPYTSNRNKPILPQLGWKLLNSQSRWSPVVYCTDYYSTWDNYNLSMEGALFRSFTSHFDPIVRVDGFIFIWFLISTWRRQNQYYSSVYW